jgi:hypothetical protein
MPCTAIKITRETGIGRLKFISQQQPKFLELLIYKCDENFQPEDEPEHNASEMDEETYHRKLREESHARGQFVPEESTNPEWNPGYKPEPDGELSSNMPG